MAIKSSDFGNIKMNRVDDDLVISTHTVVPNKRQVAKKDINKVVNRIKKYRKENG